MKLIFSSPAATAEFSKFAGILSAALSQHHLSGFEIREQYVNCELPVVQAGFRKGRGTRDQIANIHWIIEKQENSRKTSISALLTMPKTLTVWITINC